MTKMTINCATTAQMLEIIAGLVARGLGFHADADKLEITLTGAH